MLVSATLYKSEIQDASYKMMYDPAYHWYYGSRDRWPISIEGDYNGLIWHQLASIDADKNLLGFIGYTIYSETRLATNFGAVNFSDNKLVFGRDLVTAVSECFTRWGLETVEFLVIKGNPIERSYDNLCERFGGQILCTRHNRAIDTEGNLCDEKLYEITRKNFLKEVSKHAHRRQIQSK